MNTAISTQKLIIIITMVVVGFTLALFLIYTTFSNKNFAPISSTEISILSSSSQIVKIQFPQDTVSDVVSSEQFDFEVPNICKPTCALISKPFEGNQNISSDIQPSTYTFDNKDREIIGKYINSSDLESTVSTNLKDSKNQNVLVLNVPVNITTYKVYKDFPNTFKLTQESSPIDPKTQTFLYYTSEKRIAYLGDYITDIYSFQFDNTEYWLSVYLGDFVISKPDFKDWRFVNLQNKVDTISKKSDSVFEVKSKTVVDGYAEYKTEIISPQKYIIEAIFDETGED
jgi:hypothetical protein